MEVVVVDNASPGNAASRIAERHGARVLRLQENHGLPAGANAGARTARGDVVAFLSGDATAADGWLHSAAAALEDPTVAAVGPKLVLSGRYLEVVLNEDSWWSEGDSRPRGRQLLSATLSGRDVLPYLLGPGVHRVETPPEPALLGRGSGHSSPRRWRWTAGGGAPFYVPLPPGSGRVELLLNGTPVRPARVVDVLSSVGRYLREDGVVDDIGADMADEEEFDTWEERFSLNGTALVTTQEVLARVGVFAGRFSSSYHDADWCWRAQLQGFRLLFDPSTTVRQDRGAASGGVLSRRVRFLRERNRLLMLLRNGPGSLATRELWRKWRRADDDGVAEVIHRFVPRALAERALLARSWVLSPREVCERWAGVDVPPEV